MTNQKNHTRSRLTALGFAGFAAISTQLGGCASLADTAFQTFSAAGTGYEAQQYTSGSPNASPYNILAALPTPIPDYPANCSTRPAVVSDVSHSAIYNDVCVRKPDGTKQAVPFTEILGGDRSDGDSNFSFGAATIAQRVTDILRFPDLVKPDHFKPVNWNSAADGVPRAAHAGIQAQLQIMSNNIIDYRIPGSAQAERCVAVRLTLPPQQVPAGSHSGAQIEGVTTRVLSCESGKSVRVPAFPSALKLTP